MDIEQFLQKAGLKFEKEVRLGGYFCDYFLTEERVVIESDGSWHRVEDTNDFQSSTHARNFYYLQRGFKLVLVDWRRLERAASKEDKHKYLGQLME